ncbi:exported hypothetical protein [Candidatus Zixiibacteriota bacterium]|nr:exported hypothetical protein [candidate division Zixibacteria bacterium]
MFGKKIKFGALILLIVLLAVSGCGKRRFHDKGAKAAPTDSLVVTVKGENGTSVFDLTARDHKIDYIETSSGIFIKGIDSVESNFQYGWLYSVNDSVAQVAADKYLTSDGDTIKWHFRKFQNGY